MSALCFEASSSRRKGVLPNSVGQAFQPVGRLLAVAAATLALGSLASAQPQSIRTLAGGAAQGTTNGFGSNARFNHPCGVAADAAGNIYVADTENSMLRKITPDGYASTFAGLAGSAGSTDGSGTNARFYGPQAVAADNAGRLFVADTANSTIRKVTAAGVVTTFAGVAGSFNSLDGPGVNARFYHPEGLALDAGGNVYVADTWNHTIRKLTPAGAVSTLAGLAGNFGAADGTNSKARFNRPAGVAVDGATNVFVADSLNHTIREITPAGTVTTIAGSPGLWGSADGTNISARFYLPEGLSISPNGDLWVADTGNQMLRKVSLLGTNRVVSTVAGLNGLAGNANGTGNSALFYFPAGTAVDADSYLYVADTANNLMRTTRIVPPTLQVNRAANQFIVSWPSSAEGFSLEQKSGDLGAPWAPATNGVVAVADNFVRTNSIDGSAFYRLRFP